MILETFLRELDDLLVKTGKEFSIAVEKVKADLAKAIEDSEKHRIEEAKNDDRPDSNLDTFNQNDKQF